VKRRADAIENFYSEEFEAVLVRNQCPENKRRMAQKWAEYAVHDVLESLNVGLSGTDDWVLAYNGALDSVYPPEEAEVNTSPQMLEANPMDLEMTDKCKEACYEWREKVASALEMMDTRTRGEEAFQEQYNEAMRGFQILANRMIPLRCMGTSRDLSNATQFIFLTLRELDEGDETRGSTTQLGI